MEYNFNTNYVVELAHYILNNHTTIRATAKAFNMPKSTVHHYLSVKLKQINKPLYIEVKKLLEENFSIKHLHGGESTKHKYAQLKAAVSKFEEAEALLTN